MSRSRVGPLAPERVAELTTAPLTYPLIGDDRLALAVPPGYRRFERSRQVGHGDADFRRAGEQLLSWRLQLGAGLDVLASSETIAPGTVCELRIGADPLRICAPCRVVAVHDDEHARGFTYGTLPGHPESGEELFLVELRSDGAVRLRIRAFSRPATRLAAWSGPVGRMAQSLITERYLRAVH